MKATATSKSLEREDSVYREFRSLASDRRRRVALRILRDERVLQDLYDHFLIQETLRETGRNVSWPSYLRHRKSSGR
jgi:hypothetical protein